MAGKATIADVLNEGFQAAMFGGVATFATAGGVVDTLLTRASNWAQSKVGVNNYNGATSPSYLFDCLLHAEVAYASCELWRRRIAFIDGSATLNLDAGNRSAMLAEARKLSDATNGDVIFWIGEAQRALGLDVQADIPGTGMASGMIETGMLPQTVAAARNYGGPQ